MDIQFIFALIHEATPIAILGIIGWAVDRIYQSVRATEYMLDHYLHDDEYNRDYDMGDAVEIIPPVK